MVNNATQNSTASFCYKPFAEDDAAAAAVAVVNADIIISHNSNTPNLSITLQQHHIS
jgi:hypothetical protein